MIDCNGNDVTQKSKDFIDSLEERLIKSERQFENCDRCKQKIRAEIFINKPCVSEQACHEDKMKVLEKIRAEIEDTLYVDSLIFGKLIDFKNGKISADDVIEEFNQVTKIEILHILDKCKAESEDMNEH